MGLDLTVAPIQFHTMDWWLANNRLSFDRNYALFSQIAPIGRGDGKLVCKPKPLPEGKRLDWYADEGCKQVTEDPYGTPLTYVPAAEFRKVKPKGTNDWNKAILAFLKTLPPDTPVVLWWH